MRISPCHRIAWGEVWTSLVSHNRVGNISSHSAGTAVGEGGLISWKVWSEVTYCLYNKTFSGCFPIFCCDISCFLGLLSLCSPCRMWRKTQMYTTASLPFLWWCPAWTSARHQSQGWTHIRLSSCPQGMPLWDGHASFPCAAQAVCPNPEWVFHSTISGDVLLTDVTIRSDYGSLI